MQKHDANVFDIDESYLAPSFNVCPPSFQPVVRLNRDTGQRELTIMRWSLVPFGSKDGTAAFNTINGKAETAATGLTYGEPWKRRCPIPADLLYE